MSTKIFVNLPVKNLQKSIAFFSQLGYRFDARFTDDTAACMIVSEHIYSMLITEEKFATFTPHPIADARKSTEVLIAISQPNRKAVDEIVRNALAAGGTTFKEPKDHGFMYEHGFRDLDGHLWEVMYLDEAAVEEMAA